MRSRGLVGVEAASIPRFDALEVTDSYKLAGTIELGPLLDMVSGALEALDIAYDLFREADAESDAILGAAAGATIHAAAPGEDSDISAATAAAGDGAEAEAADDDEADEEDGEVETEEEGTALTASSLAQALLSLQRAGT